MTPEQRAYRDMWLAEMGAPCRERPREERAVDAALGQARLGAQPVDNGAENVDRSVA